MGAGIRDWIRNHSAMAGMLALVVALGAIGYTLRSAAQGPPTASTQAFYTTDEGQTVFVADMNKSIPPFEHNGKTAYRVWMYTCDGGKTKFPGYLERCTPEGKKRIESARVSGTGGTPLASGDIELKRPGAGNPWVSRANTAEASKITNVTGPGGSGEAEIVRP